MKDIPTNTGPELSPTDLKISAVTSKSMHLAWSPPLSPPKKYRVVYYPSEGGTPKEVRGICWTVRRLQCLPVSGWELRQTWVGRVMRVGVQ